MEKINIDKLNELENKGLIDADAASDLRNLTQQGINVRWNGDGSRYEYITKDGFTYTGKTGKGTKQGLFRGANKSHKNISDAMAQLRGMGGFDPIKKLVPKEKETSKTNTSIVAKKFDIGVKTPSSGSLVTKTDIQGQQGNKPKDDPDGSVLPASEGDDSFIYWTNSINPSALKHLTPAEQKELIDANEANRQAAKDAKFVVAGPDNNSFIGFNKRPDASKLAQGEDFKWLSERYPDLYNQYIDSDDFLFDYAVGQANGWDVDPSMSFKYWGAGKLRDPNLHEQDPLRNVKYDDFTRNNNYKNEMSLLNASNAVLFKGLVKGAYGAGKGAFQYMARTNPAQRWADLGKLYQSIKPGNIRNPWEWMKSGARGIKNSFSKARSNFNRGKTSTNATGEVQGQTRGLLQRPRAQIDPNGATGYEGTQTSLFGNSLGPRSNISANIMGGADDAAAAASNQYSIPFRAPTATPGTVPGPNKLPSITDYIRNSLGIVDDGINIAVKEGTQLPLGLKKGGVLKVKKLIPKAEDGGEFIDGQWVPWEGDLITTGGKKTKGEKTDNTGSKVEVNNTTPKDPYLKTAVGDFTGNQAARVGLHTALTPKTNLERGAIEKLPNVTERAGVVETGMGSAAEMALKQQAANIMGGGDSTADTNVNRQDALARTLAARDIETQGILTNDEILRGQIDKNLVVENENRGLIDARRVEQANQTTTDNMLTAQLNNQQQAADAARQASIRDTLTGALAEGDYNQKMNNFNNITEVENWKKTELANLDSDMSLSQEQRDAKTREIHENYKRLRQHFTSYEGVDFEGLLSSWNTKDGSGTVTE